MIPPGQLLFLTPNTAPEAPHQPNVFLDTTETPGVCLRKNRDGYFVVLEGASDRSAWVGVYPSAAEALEGAARVLHVDTTPHNIALRSP